MNTNTRIDDGGPLFIQIGGKAITSMTLRDYFAGQAIAGLLANQKTPNAVDGKYPDVLGIFAYEAADAMIAARKEKP